MKQRFFSIFMIVALMASVLAGAMSVSFVSANTSAASGDAYLDDIYDYLVSTNAFNTTTLTQWFDYVEPFVENETAGYFMVALEEDGNWLINLYQFKYDNVGTQPYTFYTGYNSQSGLSYYSNGNANYNYADFWNKATLKYYDGYGSCSISQSSVGLYRNSAYVWTTTASTADKAIPNVYEKDYVGRNVYCSMAMAQSANSNYTFSKNLFAGSATVYFDLGVFWLGTRQYLSILQQDLIRDLDPEHLNDASLLVYLYHSGDGDYKEFTYNDVTLLPGDWQYFINLNFTNVSPMGLYAIDITGNDWDIITGAEIVHFDDDYEVYAVSDSRIEMNQGIPGTDGTPDSYTQSFNYFSEYVNNYNTTHVIPETLAETLFGLNGSKMYPCEVSVPVSISNEFDLTEATSFADVHNWRWWFSSRDDLGMNFELMDVCIIPMSSTGNYSIVYYYSDSLSVQFEFVSNMSFEDVCNNFDIVIIIPDDQHVLSSVNYWKLAYQSILAILNRDPSYFDNSWLSYQGITGSSSLGIEYLAARPDRGDYAGILDGFCIVTKKALQRQQLFVFNDGITKTYKLMSDYIENRGLWEDSFLAWTISLFEQWQTLDGRLSSIYNLLFDLHLSDWMVNIQTKLDQLVENTSETEWNFWYMDLFLWVDQFKPSNSDFIVSLNRYDDLWDDFPELPAPTVIPLLPGD